MNTVKDRVRVLIVDDSALMRQLLTEILSRDAAIEVVGAASDPIIAQDKILRLKPDVLTLDVEMPRMDGLSFLEKLMRSHAMPVVMISSLTERGCETTIRALELGAVDFVTKPRIDVCSGTLDHAEEIIAKVKMAACAQVRRVKPLANMPTGTARPSRVVTENRTTSIAFRATNKVIAIGASTGGTEALVRVLRTLPADAPGIVIVQHMPEGFTRSFAARLDSLCRIRVKEAENGDRILAGHALLAPGNFHMEVTCSGAIASVRVFSADPVNRHRPSVDVLFHSCAQSLRGNAIGVILTGMGADGARGLLEMRQAGSRTVAQDEATCVVFGMPREAIAMGGAEEVAGIDQIGPAMLRFAAIR